MDDFNMKGNRMYTSKQVESRSAASVKVEMCHNGAGPGPRNSRNESANATSSVGVATATGNSSSGGSTAREGKKMGMMDMFLVQIREVQQVIRYRCN